MKKLTLLTCGGLLALLALGYFYHSYLSTPIAFSQINRTTDYFELPSTPAGHYCLTYGATTENPHPSQVQPAPLNFIMLHLNNHLYYPAPFGFPKDGGTLISYTSGHMPIPLFYLDDYNIWFCNEGGKWQRYHIDNPEAFVVYLQEFYCAVQSTLYFN